MSTQYSIEDKNTWSILYNRQVKSVADHAFAPFMPALQQLGLSDNEVADLPTLSNRLHSLTGWQLYPVDGLIDNDYFFKQMLDNKFGTTIWLRKPEQIDYLEEPDMFHDIFGHVPLLVLSNINQYLHGLAVIAAEQNYGPDVVEAIARLYWFTVEFGLIKENGTLKIYGAGILSSIAETEYCMSDKANLVPFSVEAIINTPYIKDTFQAQYFVLDNTDVLPKALSDFKDIIRRRQIPVYQKAAS